MEIFLPFSQEGAAAPPLAEVHATREKNLLSLSLHLLSPPSSSLFSLLPKQTNKREKKRRRKRKRQRKKGEIKEKILRRPHIRIRKKNRDQKDEEEVNGCLSYSPSSSSFSFFLSTSSLSPSSLSFSLFSQPSFSHNNSNYAFT